MGQVSRKPSIFLSDVALRGILILFKCKKNGDVFLALNSFGRVAVYLFPYYEIDTQLAKVHVGYVSVFVILWNFCDIVIY